MIRATLFLLWISVSVIPYAVIILALSAFVRGDFLYRLALSWLSQIIRTATVLGGVKYRVQGLENIPGADSNEPIVLCPKHQSTWETFALPCVMPHPLAYVFKRELLRIPFFGWALGRLSMVHIDRSQRSDAWKRMAEQGRELMKQGIWIIIFPEGTRTERGSQGIYKSGASRLAVSTGASLVPIAVTSGRCWPRRSFRLIPGTIEVSIAPPIPSAGRTPNELMKEAEAWIEAEMRRLDPAAYPPEPGGS